MAEKKYFVDDSYSVQLRKQDDARKKAIRESKNIYKTSSDSVLEEQLRLKEIKDNLDNRRNNLNSVSSSNSTEQELSDMYESNKKKYSKLMSSKTYTVGSIGSSMIYVAPDYFNNFFKSYTEKLHSTIDFFEQTTKKVLNKLSNNISTQTEEAAQNTEKLVSQTAENLKILDFFSSPITSSLKNYSKWVIGGGSLAQLGLGVTGGISSAYSMNRLASEKKYANQLGNIGRASRVFSNLNLASGLGYTLPMTMMTGAFGASDALSIKSSLGMMSGMTALGKGTSSLMASAGLPLASMGIFLPVIASIFSNIVKANRLGKINVTKPKIDAVQKQYSGSPSLTPFIQRMISRGELSGPDQIKIQLLSLIESHSSLIAPIYEEMDIIHQERVKGHNNATEEYTSIVGEKKYNIVDRKMDSIEYLLQSATNKYNPFVQLMNLLVLRKTPKQIQQELDENYKEVSSKKIIEKEKERAQNLGITKTQSQLLKTSAQNVLASGNTYEAKMILLQAGIYDITRFVLSELITVRKFGTGSETNINYADPEKDRRGFFRKIGDFITGLPVISAGWNITKGIINSGKNIMDFVGSIPDKYNEYYKKTILNNIDKDTFKKQFNIEMGNNKSLQEKSTEYISSALPSILEDIRFQNKEQTILQTRQVDILEDLYRAITGQEKEYDNNVYNENFLKNKNRVYDYKSKRYVYAEDYDRDIKYRKEIAKQKLLEDWSTTPMDLYGSARRALSKFNFDNFLTMAQNFVKGEPVEKLKLFRNNEEAFDKLASSLNIENKPADYIRTFATSVLKNSKLNSDSIPGKILLTGANLKLNAQQLKKLNLKDLNLKNLNPEDLNFKDLKFEKLLSSNDDVLNYIKEYIPEFNQPSRNNILDKILFPLTKLKSKKISGNNISSYSDLAFLENSSVNIPYGIDDDTTKYFASEIKKQVKNKKKNYLRSSAFGIPSLLATGGLTALFGPAGLLFGGLLTGTTGLLNKSLQYDEYDKSLSNITSINEDKNRNKYDIDNSVKLQQELGNISPNLVNKKRNSIAIKYQAEPIFYKKQNKKNTSLLTRDIRKLILENEDKTLITLQKIEEYGLDSKNYLEIISDYFSNKEYKDREKEEKRKEVNLEINDDSILLSIDSLLKENKIKNKEEIEEVFSNKNFDYNYNTSEYDSIEFGKNNIAEKMKRDDIEREKKKKEERDENIENILLQIEKNTKQSIRSSESVKTTSVIGSLFSFLIDLLKNPLSSIITLLGTAVGGISALGGAILGGVVGKINLKKIASSTGAGLTKLKNVIKPSSLKSGLKTVGGGVFSILNPFDGVSDLFKIGSALRHPGQTLSSTKSSLSNVGKTFSNIRQKKGMLSALGFAGKSGLKFAGKFALKAANVAGLLSEVSDFATYYYKIATNQPIEDEDKPLTILLADMITGGPSFENYIASGSDYNPGDSYLADRYRSQFFKLRNGEKTSNDSFINDYNNYNDDDNILVKQIQKKIKETISSNKNTDIGDPIENDRRIIDDNGHYVGYDILTSEQNKNRLKTSNDKTIERINYLFGFKNKNEENKTSGSNKESRSSLSYNIQPKYSRNDNNFKLDPSSNLGSIISQYESGNKGSYSIGYDSTGGTSYGIYQLASKPGTMLEFLKMLSKQGKKGSDISNRILSAGPLNTMSKYGAAPDQWIEEVNNDKQFMDSMQQKFIEETMYHPAIESLPPEIKTMIENNRALQEVAFSTIVQHGRGGARKIFKDAFKPNISVKEFMTNIYKERSTKFGSSSLQVQNSVKNRFERELGRMLKFDDIISGRIKNENKSDTSLISGDILNIEVPNDLPLASEVKNYSNKDFEKHDIKVAGNVNTFGLRDETKEKLIKLGEIFKSYQIANGINDPKNLKVNSAYRPYDKQKKLKAELGNQAATPGRSMHEYGIAIDIDRNQADILEKTGLLSKAGFYRPDKRSNERQHIEPKGINRAEIRKDGEAGSKRYQEEVYKKLAALTYNDKKESVTADNSNFDIESKRNIGDAVDPFEYMDRKSIKIMYERLLDEQHIDKNLEENTLSEDKLLAKKQRFNNLLNKYNKMNANNFINQQINKPVPQLYGVNTSMSISDDDDSIKEILRSCLNFKTNTFNYVSENDFLFS